MNDWVRDLLQLWHKPASLTPDEHGRYFVRCLSSSIDIDKKGLPGAGAQFCDMCLDESERDRDNEITADDVRRGR
jgi:hypothetical protein